MKDIQNHKDNRNIDIDQVGVKGIRYPITVLDKNVGEQQTVAEINMYVDLPRHYKGTHMSRFVEILHEHSRKVSLQNFSEILVQMKSRLNAESAHMEIAFPYFINKSAPVTGSQGLMEYRCVLKGALTAQGSDLVVLIHVPISTLCPCSKEISDYGAHNQRGEVRLQVRFKRFVWIEDLIKMVEESASSDVYSVLKREDEKFVTEHAYNHPMFVEDIVREIAMNLNKDPNITWFTVESENFESIHNHNAYAYIERHKVWFISHRVHWVAECLSWIAEGAIQLKLRHFCIQKRYIMELNSISSQIIKAAITVHKELGPGLLETVYQKCMIMELDGLGLQAESEKPIPVFYRGVEIFDQGFWIDLLVEDKVVVELKSVEKV